MRKIFSKVLLLALLFAFALSAPALAGTTYDPLTSQTLTAITQTHES